jgi:gliding motility-associated-like protein
MSVIAIKIFLPLFLMMKARISGFSLVIIFCCVMSGIICAQNATNITIHSISDARQPGGDHGYTLDGDMMKYCARLKALNPALFGPAGIYRKTVTIHDAFGKSGSLSSVTTLPLNDLFFFGSFDKSNSSTAEFTSSEIDSLYAWSLRGGKMIIAAFGGANNMQKTPVDALWSCGVATGMGKGAVMATFEGFNTWLFSGPFGIPTTVQQGGSVQGYISILPPDHRLLATDGHGNASLVMDCKTLDLIIADVDVYSKLSPVSYSDAIQSDQDRFWLNTIAFLDDLQGPPILVRHDENTIKSNSGYIAYQWYYNSEAVTGATSETITTANSGTYQVEVTVNGGCKIKSKPFLTPDIDPANNCDLFVPLAFSPNGDGTNDMACAYGFCLKQLDFKIFDRWGQMVFTSNSTSDCWDGSVNRSKGESGVYVWKADATTAAGKKISASGNITLVR